MGYVFHQGIRESTCPQMSAMPILVVRLPDKKVANLVLHGELEDVLELGRRVQPFQSEARAFLRNAIHGHTRSVLSALVGVTS